MKAKLNYKSKKAIIIAIIVLALIVVSGLAVGLFLKGNNDAEAVGNNTTIGNTIDNNANETTPPENQTNNTENKDTIDTEIDGENANNNENQEEIPDNQNKENTNNQANVNQGNTNNQNNVQYQEFVTERVEIIPERVIAENYFVSWEPTKFETLIGGQILLEKANIVAEKTVAKVTANGLEQNPESVKVGEILQYTITLRNTSNKVNGLVNVEDTIPAGTEFISATKNNLKTTPAQYDNPNEVTKLEWKNIRVEAGSKTILTIYVKVVEKANNENTTAVKNIATIYNGTTPEEDVPSPETKVANITANKTSKIIYNEQKPHEHIVVNGIEPLHEQDIIEYTITLTNVGQAAGTVKVSDTVPEGTTIINDGIVTVEDKNGTSTYEISELVEGIDVIVPEANEEAGIATVTFRVIVNTFDTEIKVIRNEMAKVDGSSTNTTEDEAEKLYIDIPVTKIWDNMESDAAQVYKLNSIKFQVKNGENIVAEKEVTENDEWSYIFQNLPKYDEIGNEINYMVVEKATNIDEQEILNTYYNVNTSISRKLAETSVTITNTFDPSKVQDETIEIVAQKEWKNLDSDAAAEYAISSIILEVRVYAEDGNYALAAVKEVTAEDNWTHTFTNLKKYDVNGNEIIYVVDEVASNNKDAEKLEVYNKEITTEDGNIIVTNTFDPAKVQEDKIELTAKKVWANLDSDAAKDYEITRITLQVKLNGEVVQEQEVTAENNWTHTFKNLKKYDENGNYLVYTIDEKVSEEDAEKLAAYDKLIEGTTITNTFNPDKVQDDTTELTAQKVWEDDNNHAGVRPTAVEFVLVKDGVETEISLTANESNSWTVTFENLNKYKADGTEIVYTVKEIEVEHYNTTYSEDGLTVTNTIDYTTIMTEKTAEKVWEDDNNHAGVRPTAVEFVLVKDGVETETSLTANESNSWTVKFENLNKYKADGTEIVYTVKEIKVEHYNTTYSEDGLTVTNTIDYTTIMTPITIKKVWKDSSNAYLTRPQNVVLVFEGTNYTLNAENDTNRETTDEWTYVIENVQKYNEDGSEIQYSVTEPTVPAGYTKTESGLTVTNTADVIVEKSAYKANENGLIGDIANQEEFKAGDIVYYKLTFKNAGNDEITKTLTDTLSLRFELLEIDGISISESVTSGDDGDGCTWEVTTDIAGHKVINWTLTNLAGGAQKELTIKVRISEEAEYKDLCHKTGEETENTATLYINKNESTYTTSLGTVYLSSLDFSNVEETLPSDDLYYLLKNNNAIVELVSKGVSRDEIKESLEENDINLENNEVILWYAIRNEDGEYNIYGQIKETSELTVIENAVFMDNIKKDEVIIDLEDIEIGQSGTVTVKGISSTSASVSTPMDVVFILDTSGSMDNKLEGQTQRKAQNMVNAVNTTIATIMSKNADSRIGIVGYSDSASTIIPLGDYSEHEGDYISLAEAGQRWKYRYINSNIAAGTDRNISGGTNTQAGIKLGAEMLTAEGLTRTFTTTVNGVEFTGKRTPVIILVTDGEPTYCYLNETATGTVTGEGYTSDTDENYYYWTLRTASYYKGQVKNAYYGATGTQQAKMFTIGIGLDGELATTMLNPNRTNIDNLSVETNLQGIQVPAEEGTEEKELYDLLVATGTPYAYSYADASTLGALTEQEIQNFLNTSLNASTESFNVRNITVEESKARRIDLTNIDTEKEFLLTITPAEGATIEIDSLEEALTTENGEYGPYVKEDGETGILYVDLTGIDRDATVNITYWEE